MKTDTVTVTLTPAERHVAASALEVWLATYAQGPRPADYDAAVSALKKIEEN